MNGVKANVDGGLNQIFVKSDDEFPFLFLTRSKKSGLAPKHKLPPMARKSLVMPRSLPVDSTTVLIFHLSVACSSFCTSN